MDDLLIQMIHIGMDGIFKWMIYVNVDDLLIHMI